MEDYNLCKISNIYEYLNKLNNLELDDYFILIATRDNPISSINEKIKSSLFSLGLKESMVKEDLCGYIAILNNQDVIYEYCGGKNISIKCDLEIEGYCIDIQTKPYLVGNLIMIIIGSAQCAVNSRGINIVVFDKLERKVIDSVCFDTHTADYKITRKDCSYMKKYFFKNKMNVSIDNTSSRGIINALDEFKLANCQDDIKFWQLYRKESESELDSRKRFFRGLECTDPQMVLAQKNISILLYYFDKICRENSIKYAVLHGSLIGAIRHGGCIPWDDDIDVWMYRKDVYKVEKIVRESSEFNLTITYDSRQHICVYRFKFKNRPIPCFIDIFVIDSVGDTTDLTWNKHKQLRREMVSALKVLDKEIALDSVYKKLSDVKEVADMFDAYIKKEQVMLNPNNSDKAIIWGIDNFDFPSKNVLNYDELFPTRTVPFAYGTCEIPAKAEAILQRLYGDIYTLPKDMLSRRHVTLNANSEKAMKAVIDEYEPKIKAETADKNKGN